MDNTNFKVSREPDHVRLELRFGYSMRAFRFTPEQAQDLQSQLLEAAGGSSELDKPEGPLDL